jgi:hypothetical protein
MNHDPAACRSARPGPWPRLRACCIAHPGRVWLRH